MLSIILEDYLKGKHVNLSVHVYAVASGAGWSLAQPEATQRFAAMASSNPTPPPANNQIYVWQQSLNICANRLDRLRSILSPDERDRAERFHDPTESANFIAGRGILRTILALYTGVPPHALAFTYNRFGKPSLTNTGGPHLHFNLAHSGSRMLLAIARDREVGIDLEQCRFERVDRRVVERLFSPDDLRHLDRLPRSAQTTWFFRRWTRMEALLKGRGSGFATTDWMRRDSSPSIAASLDEYPGAADWSLRELDLGSDYIGALAAPGSAWSIIMCCKETGIPH